MTINDAIDINALLQVNKPERFVLPYSAYEIKNALLIAYESEVRQRGGKMNGWLGETPVADLLSSMAEWIADKDGKPGLLLYGGVGTGKTTALRSLRRVINASVKKEYNDIVLTDNIDSVLDIIKAKEVVDAYTGNPMHFMNMKRTNLLAIDELGVENVDVRSYGNENEPIIDLLNYRYDKMKVTAITSNLTIKQIQERYGVRMADRFNEMFHKVAFVGDSYRGAKTRGQ